MYINHQGGPKNEIFFSLYMVNLNVQKMYSTTNIFLLRCRLCDTSSNIFKNYLYNIYARQNFFKKFDQWQHLRMRYKLWKQFADPKTRFFKMFGLV